jgi:hypothetical protein
VPTDARFDPWWIYTMCSGRQLPALAARLWAALPPEQP